MSLRCPQCQKTIPIDSNAPPQDLLCSSCGTAFVRSDGMAVTLVRGPGVETMTYVRADHRDDSPSKNSEVSAFGKNSFAGYEILEEIARGGMGVVYKARQTKLNRIVALKMIKSGGLAGDDEVQRFHAEAKAAAALNHPNIVPIHEVGECDGQHFFSMGFVDGEGLDSRLKNGPLPPREAADLINTIAAAVQYAHDNGIVHRDLKPGNVLLSEDARPIEPGRVAPGHHPADTTAEESRTTVARADTARLYSPRITDFGLAKNLAADSGMTATGQILGTPSYMPPEQAAGKIKEIGPLADVYSLGAMFYAMLTGRPPFQAANVMETLKQVLERDPVPPRQLNPEVDRDLETICLKCLEKDPGKRYASAEELCNDLKRHKEGKPIVARPLGRVARMYRWCRRNKWATAAIVLGALVFFGSPLVAVIQTELRDEARENLRLAIKNRDRFKTEKERADGNVVQLNNANKNLRKALAGETAAKKLAKANERDAQANEKRAKSNWELANKNLGQADEVVEKFLLEIGKEGGPLSRLASTQQVRKKLLMMGKEYYEKLIADNPAAQLSPRLAEANFHLGFVLVQLSGDKGKALEAFQKAVQQIGRLAHDNPSVTGHRYNLANSLNSIGLLYRQTAKPAKALAAFQQAIQIFERLANENPTLTDYQAHLAGSQFNLGLLYRRTGKPTEALAVYRQALKIRKRLARENPMVTEHQKDLAGSYVNLGVLYQLTGRPEEALAVYRQALRIQERLVRKNPEVAEHRFDLAGSHLNIGAHYIQAGKPVEALAAYRRALKIHERLVRENPTAADFLRTLAVNHYNIGALYSQTGRAPEALAAFQQARKIRERLARENPTVTRFQDHLAQTLNHIGDLDSLIGKPTEASAAFQLALKIREQLAREHPTVTEFQKDLAASYGKLGTLYRATGKPAKALAVHQQIVRIFERLTRENPSVTEYQTSLAGHCVNLADLVRPQEPNEALSLLKKAVSILVNVLKREPRNATARLFQRNAHAIRAITLAALARHREAAENWRQALELSNGRTRFYFQRRICLSLARSGQHVQATALADQLLRMNGQAGVAYDLACGYAISTDAAARDATLNSDNCKRLTARYVTTALTLLKSLARSGYFRIAENLTKIRTDPNLNALRHREDFRAFAKSVGVKLPTWAKKPRAMMPVRRKPPIVTPKPRAKSGS